MDNETFYPFGFGLSYTDSASSDLKLTPAEVNISSSAEVSCRVKNTRDVRGKEVVQFYIEDNYASMTRLQRELKKFKNSTSKQGKGSGSISPFTNLLSFYDKEMNLVVEIGKFDILIDISSTDNRLEGSFEIVGEEKELGWSRRYFTETWMK